jgi:hypothetical protein
MITYHRLYREAARTARITRFSVQLGILGLASRVTTWFMPHHPITVIAVEQNIVAAISLGFWFVISRRWAARRDWYATTERWWERLDEAPPVVPFPWLIDRLGRRREYVSENVS